MKKTLAIFALLGALAVPARANYRKDLVANNALAHDENYALNLETNSITSVSFQANYSSGIFTSSTFDDGRVATGSITAGSVSHLTSNYATNYISLLPTASMPAVAASDHITLNASTAGMSGAFLLVNGIRLTWTASATSSGTAVNIKNRLNTFPGIVASTAGPGGRVIYATATAAGLGGNKFTIISSTPSAITVATANFTGGRENALINAVLTVNGRAYRNGYEWKQQNTSSGTATNIAAFLSRISGIQAAASGTVVYATITTQGPGGNAYTLVSSSPTAMTVGGSVFAGGRSTMTVTIGTVTLTYGTQISVSASTTLLASNIAAAINSAFAGVIQATNTTNVVRATSTATGSQYNYAMSSNLSDITFSGTVMTGGTDSDWVVNTPTISVPSHGWGLGQAVLYSTPSASISITGLTNQTTYYVVPLDANSVKLASSLSNALAGTVISLASHLTTGPHTFTLAPLTFSGTASFKWQQSNDGSNWSDISVSSVTFSTPYTPTSTFWDMGAINAVWVRLKFTAQSAGGFVIRVLTNGKR